MIKTKAMEKHSVYWMNELPRVKAAIAPRLQVAEFERFVKFLLHMGADPYTGEIHPQAFKNSDGTTTVSYIITRDFRNRVAKTKSNYRRHVARCVYENDDFAEDLVLNKIIHTPNRQDPGKLMGAYCLVWKKDEEIPDYLYRHFEEYRWKTAKGGGKAPRSPFWALMPDTMMSKVVEAQALKLAYPEAFSNTFDRAELPEPDGNGYIEAESEYVVEETPSYPEGPPPEPEPEPEAKPEPKEQKKNGKKEKPPTDDEKMELMDDIVNKLGQKTDEFLFTVKIKSTDEIKTWTQIDGIRAALKEFIDKRV